MKRPDYRTLQALDAVIRERGFERAAQKLCITQSAVSQRIKQLENMFGQPLLVRTVPPRPTEQGQKLLALLRQVELLEEEWLGDEQTGSTPLLLSLAVNADSLATWLLPALAPVLGLLGIPPETAALLLVRPVSGSGALAVGSQIMEQSGPDSAVGRTAAVMLGCSETTFYTVAVYFGAAGIRRTRYTIPAALTADLAAGVAAAWAVRLCFG